MILLIDNYDSFTYNLLQCIEVSGYAVDIVRNDAATVEELAALAPSHVIVSPGPGRPEDAGVSVAAIRHFAGKVPVLGVCLGHQAMAVAFGGRVVYAPRVMHGKTSLIIHDGRGLYASLPNPFQAARYHSLIVDEAALPVGFVACSHTEEDELMGIRHVEWPMEGIQCHPESYLTPDGNTLIQNFLEQAMDNTV